MTRGILRLSAAKSKRRRVSTGAGVSVIERPDSVPREGQVDAFDAGWNAHEKGLGRETVRVLSPTEDARRWALMAWDVRALLAARLDGSSDE